MDLDELLHSATGMVISFSDGLSYVVGFGFCRDGELLDRQEWVPEVKRRFDSTNADARTLGYRKARATYEAKAKAQMDAVRASVQPRESRTSPSPRDSDPPAQPR